MTLQLDEASEGEKRFRLGAKLYEAGQPGQAWRVLDGSVRLDRPGPDGLMFASLAVAGDVIGAETLLFGQYEFVARALSDCAIAPWADQQARPRESLLQALALGERRAADVIALRAGQAAERVRRLMLLLTRQQRAGACDVSGKPLACASGLSTRMAMPPLRDMADITGLTAETVSRVLSGMRREGVLSREGWRHAHLAPARLLPDD